MARLLLTVENSQKVKTYGVRVAPFLPDDQIPAPLWWRHVRIDCPDGMIWYSTLGCVMVYDATSSEKFYHVCFMRDVLDEKFVPPGTKLWVLEDDEHRTLLTVASFGLIAILGLFSIVYADRSLLPVGAIVFLILVAMLSIVYNRLVHIMPWRKSVLRALALLVITPIALWVASVLAGWLGWGPS